MASKAHLFDCCGHVFSLQNLFACSPSVVIYKDRAKWSFWCNSAFRPQISVDTWSPRCWRVPYGSEANVDRSLVHDLGKAAL